MTDPIWYITRLWWIMVGIGFLCIFVKAYGNRHTARRRKKENS